MKFIKENYYQELVEELQVITGKKFTPDQFSRLFEGFKKIEWNKACQIVRDFERQERFPTNIYGVIANRIEDQYREQTQAAYIQDKWKISDNDKTSALEAELWFAIIEEAKLWISLKLDHYREEFAYIRDLPPPGQKCRSWSGIIDYAINMWIEFTEKIKNATLQQREELLKNVLDICKKERIEKTTNKCGICGIQGLQEVN